MSVKGFGDKSTDKILLYVALGLGAWFLSQAGAGLSKLFGAFGNATSALADATNGITNFGRDISKNFNTAPGSPADQAINPSGDYQMDPSQGLGPGRSPNSPGQVLPDYAPDTSWQPSAAPGTDPASFPSGYWGYDASGNPLPGPYGPGY